MDKQTKRYRERKIRESGTILKHGGFTIVVNKEVAGEPYFGKTRSGTVWNANIYDKKDKLLEELYAPVKKQVIERARQSIERKLPTSVSYV
jgi:hypothetical protein